MVHVGRTGDEKSIQCWSEDPEGKRPLGRPRHRCEDDINMDLGEIGWERIDLVHLVQDRYQW